MVADEAQRRAAAEGLALSRREREAEELHGAEALLADLAAVEARRGGTAVDVEAQMLLESAQRGEFLNTFKFVGKLEHQRRGELGAGRMLELCGLKGYRIGGAVISPRHANFIENAEGATSADCLALMFEAHRRAREQYGVELEHEVVLWGLTPLAPDA